jgi:hypothetical protein
MEAAMEEAHRLIVELDRARAATHLMLKTIGLRQEIYPGWSLKEFLAHLAGWDECTLAALEAHAIGNVPNTPAKIGIDDYNKLSIEKRKELPYARVSAEFEQVREELKARIRTLPAGKYKEPLVYPWGPRGSVRKLVEIMIHHEIEHVEELEQKLPGGR